MQARDAWIPPGGTLGSLVKSAEGRVAQLLANRPALERAQLTAPVTVSFEGALRSAVEQGLVAVIAEIKRASPSKGALNASMDAFAQARAFESGGAVAISVLTETDRFQGSNDDVAEAGRGSSLPILKKDFHIHPIQALEARAIGASAMLLIARALGPDGLRAMGQAAADVGIEIVVEIRDEAELDWALGIDAPVVGVNNRNLETLVIDPLAGERIIPLIPSDRIAVAESGIRSAGDARAAAALGADAILVGSSLSTAPDPVAAVRALSSISRRGRGR